MDGRKPKTSLVMPILLIAIGALFLFRNWHPGFEPFQFLRTNWQLTLALILILVGLGKIWDSSRNRTGDGASSGIALGSTLGVVAFVFVLIIVLGHYQKVHHRDDPMSGFASHTQQTIDLQGAKSATADLHLGAGRLTVSGGSAHLLNADFHFDPKWDDPTADYSLPARTALLHPNPYTAHPNLLPSLNSSHPPFS